MVFQLMVLGPEGEEKVIDLCDTQAQMKRMTVNQLKEKISQHFNISGEFRVVFRTEPLPERFKLSSYEIQHMSTIHTVLLLPGGV